MALFTIGEVKDAAGRAAGSVLMEGVLGSLRAESYFEKQAEDFQRRPIEKFDIFLSHAYADKVLVAGIYALLVGTGFSVYVDWIHDKNRLDRTKVTAANAAILRERMHQCDALLYTTTQNHSASKWMPWECGYFDGHDSRTVTTYSGITKIQSGHVAILPVVERADTAFKGQEYLELYPVAQKGHLTRRNLNIHNQKVDYMFMSFDDWVKNGHP